MTSSPPPNGSLLSAHHNLTSPPSSAASNGGLLVGACADPTARRFSAPSLAYVGVMDMLRFDQFGQGAGWEGDYGSPHNVEDFKALYAYSPYHNVRPRTRYPATLVVTGDHDSRVMPAHSFSSWPHSRQRKPGPLPFCCASNSPQVTAADQTRAR